MQHVELATQSTAVSTFGLDCVSRSLQLTISHPFTKTTDVRESLGTPSRERFRRDIQGLRALAVILVIGNHADAPGFAGGYVGVDMFFVVSGYVITQLLLRETSKGIREGLADFYSRRIRRIVPAATATLVATMLAAEITLGLHMNPHLPGDARWASLFVANFRLIETGSNYFVPGTYPSLITQFWSLAVEEQFYLVFPLAIFLIGRYVAPEWRLKILRSTLGIAIALSAWWSMNISTSEPTAAYYSPFTRFWELGLGCLLATLTMGRPTRTARSDQLASASGVVLLVIALLTLNSTSTYPGALAWLPCGSAVLFIWAGVADVRTPIGRLLASRPLVYVGDISYSLYLMHYLWLKLPEQLPTPLTGWVWRLVEIVGTAITAVLSYHLLENPIRHSKRLATDRVAAFLLLCVCVATSWMIAAVVTRLAHLS
jgi:peptidoglycan/LPS O-acetylase OafA/YrhL